MIVFESSTVREDRSMAFHHADREEHEVWNGQFFETFVVKF
jgi:hypothetical protein